MPVRAGQVIAHKYRVDELLGAGSSGLVVAAKHVWLRYSVCLKILAAYTDGQLEILERQVERARVAMRLRGKHVARIRDIGLTQDKMPYVATELLLGKPLDAELAERGRLPVTEAVRLVLEACEGLAEAHAIDLVHGDLKPANLFLADNNDGGRILKILDFGMMSPIEAIGDAGASTWFASPAYLAPELIKDPDSVDPRADIWSLGVILYELISGRLPFTADTVSGMLVSVVMDEPAFLTDAPYDLARLVHRCLAKTPEDRPADVATLARELARFASEEDAVAVERVREALASPPPEEPPSPDEEEEDSLAPVSRNSTPVLPLVKRRGKHPAWEEPTGPSQRVLSERRRVRIRNVVLGAIAIMTGLALASVVDLVTGASPDPMLLEDDVAPTVQRGFEPPAFVPPTQEVERRVAASPRQTPLTKNKARGPVMASRRMAKAAPLRSPVKDQSPPPSRRSDPPPSLPAPPRDDPDTRNLFTSRK